MISGWFGIHVKRKSFVSFLFQWLFFAMLLLICYPLLQENNIKSFPKLIYDVISMNRLWFVPSYIVLYLVAPVLNAFVERSTKLQFKIVLIAFFSYEFIWGWLLNGANGIFMGGTSPLSFGGLYLLARYLRIYPPHLSQNIKFQVFAFIALIILPCILSFVVLKCLGSYIWVLYTNKQFSYLNPNVVLCALFVLILFSQLKITSRFINQIAVSAFAVYLFHEHPCIKPHFSEVILFLYNSYSGVVFLLFAFGFMVLIFVLGILLDQVRIWIWSLVSAHLFRANVSKTNEKRHKHLIVN